MRAEAAQRLESGTRGIMIVGSILCSGVPLAAVGLASLVGESLFRGKDLHLWISLILIPLLPVAVGGVIALSGMTLPSPIRSVKEWGLVRPTRCAAWGLAPYFFLGIESLSLMFLAILVAWVLTIAGAMITGAILTRTTRTKV